MNSQLIGTVGVGTPPQEFKLIFETAYANMFIPSLKCTNCGDKKRYNSSASSTYIEDGTYIQTGWDAGFRSIDQVTLGDVVIKNQTFAEMTELEANFVPMPYDGLFCLGFDFLAQEDVVTPLRQMVNQRLIDREVFSIYQNSTGGEILFGGVDDSRIQNLINWQPNADLDAWAFRMDSLTLKEGSKSEEVTVCAYGCKVNIFTYFSYIVGPPEEVKMINDALGAEPDEDDERIFVLPDCDLSKHPDLVFKIHHDYHVFKPERYIQKVEKNGKITCVSSLHAAIPYQFPNEWFVGSSVIGHIHTVFDFENRAVGFVYNK